MEVLLKCWCMLLSSYCQLEYQPLLKNATPYFPPSPPPLTLQTVQAPLFRQFLPRCCFFMNPPPSLKEMDFSVNSDNIKTSSLTPSHFLKVSFKFLVKIYQCKFLVMTEKNIFVYKLFFVIKYLGFSLFFL